MLRDVRFLLVTLSLLACGDDARPETTAPAGAAARPVAPAPDFDTERRRVLGEADARVLGDALSNGLASPDARLRAVAALGLGRLHDPASIPHLRRGLRDSDIAVRSNASLGLGAFEAEAPPEVERALLGAVAAEVEVETRGRMLWDLGRVGSLAALPAFRSALASDRAPVRVGACRGLASYGLRDVTVPAALLRRIAARVVDDVDREVRASCAYAMTRLSIPMGEPAHQQAIVEDLARASADEDAAVRAMAVRALGKYPDARLEILGARTADPEWTVAVQAFRALGAVTGEDEQELATAVRRRLDRALDGPLEGPQLHVLLGALGALDRFAGRSSIAGVAREALDRIGALDEAARTRDAGLAHCAAALVVDLGSHQPSELLDCGFGRVTESERQSRMAQVIATAPGAVEARLAALLQLYRDGDRSVREAVLGTLGELPDGGRDGLRVLLLEGLASGDSGVATSALDALAASSARWRERPDHEGEGPIPEARVPASVQAAYLPALAGCGRELRSADDLEGLLSWMSAVAALGAESLTSEVQSLSSHWNRTVRKKSAATLEALGASPASVTVAPQPNVMADADWPPVGAQWRATVVTSRGEIALELLVDDAPGTVARFVGLAEADFYDGLTFHRVVPAFVIQGGDPRGDGYGGPGWSQRCEDNRVRYERGTVGMALAGRDTGGSQFFIAHDAQPHLDGRYTAFARVVEGMEHVDAVQPGDTISDVRIDRSAAR